MSVLDFSRLFSNVHSPFRVSINPSQPTREEKQIQQIIKVLKTYKILKNGIR
jgi:hypothetical protein